ncbi:MAG TPA: flagellar basal body P-ring formation chaperone FlgA [Bryobacteraceae bacterium]|jgi:flagella basal body P-ring formation protein FlgA|nr:flagellar basal body P-ring formation chaperone FlgA [Bryobacteraceae bacterium]
MKCTSRSTISLASLFAGLVLSAHAAVGPPGCLTIAGDRILLGDLSPVLPAAAVMDPKRMVGFAPRPGVRRTLLFREWAGTARAPVPGEPDEICVERVARVLTRQDLTTALEAAFSHAGSGLAIDIQEFPKGTVPVGKLVFPLANLRSARPDPHSGLVQLIGYIEVGFDPARPLRFPVWVRAHVESEATRVELTCPLAAGDKVGAGCIQEKTVRAYPFTQGNAAVSVEALAGRTARRRLTAGTFLQDAMFYPRQDVKPRQEISLLVRCGQANLRLKATSEGGGAEGELITVRITESNRRLRARVTAPGAAELLVPASGAAAALSRNPSKGS